MGGCRRCDNAFGLHRRRGQMVGAGWRMECIVVGRPGGHFVHVSRVNFMRLRLRLRLYYKTGTLTSSPGFLGPWAPSAVASLRL